MLFSTLTLAVSLLGLSSAVALNKRTTEVTSLYAYGANVSGLNIFYGDGLAWIGYTKPTWLNVVSNITFNEDPDSTTTAWTINSNSSLWADGAYKMYIVPTAGSFKQVGFVATNGTAANGSVTTGFNWYGTQVAYAASDSDWEMMFWGVSTNTTGIWKLMWNAASSTIPGSSTPITIKRTAPITVS